MQIMIARYETDRREEPYLYYDDCGDNPGWVLRYSLSEDLGQRHLDEPVDVDEEDACDDELLAAGQRALQRDLGHVLPPEGGGSLLFAALRAACRTIELRAAGRKMGDIQHITSASNAAARYLPRDEAFFFHSSLTSGSLCRSRHR